MKLSVCVLIVLATLAGCSPASDRSNHISPRGNRITWKRCDQSAYECGTFTTPMDYFNSSAGNAEIAMIRYRSTTKQTLGTLFVNPGGPGVSGVAFLKVHGQNISRMMAGYYDIVSWDPRGIGKTNPRINCSNSQPEADEWRQKLDFIDVKTGRTFTPTDAEALRAQEDTIDKTLSDYFKACLAVEGDKLKYVGTAATVRDLVAMADALDGPDSPVNYWGFSYGTVIGSYLINMFPERVGRVVLDGNISPFTWGSQASYLRPRNYLEGSEKTLDGFCKACAEAQFRCVLAQGRTAEQLKEHIISLIDDTFRLYPLGFYYSSADFRFDLFMGLYWPRDWNMLAQWIKELEVEMMEFSATGHNPEARRDATRRGLPLRRRLGANSGPRMMGLLGRPPLWRDGGESDDGSIVCNEYAYHAITCGDAIDAGAVTTRTVLDEIISLSQNVSPVFGPALTTEAGNFCHRWGVRSVERYPGPWNVAPANPVLVTGNTADPITPLINSEWIVNQLGANAALITQEAYGHTSASMPSSCTLQTIEKYLLTGELPPTNITCGTDTKLFRYYDGNADVPDSVWKPPKVTPVSPTGLRFRQGIPSSSGQQLVPKIVMAMMMLGFSWTMPRMIYTI